jgi:hypothetical protein
MWPGRWPGAWMMKREESEKRSMVCRKGGRGLQL